MRELDRDKPNNSAQGSAIRTGSSGAIPLRKVLTTAVIGAGRAGTTFARGFRSAGLNVVGPLGRGDRIDRSAVDVVLICVPDSAIAEVAADLPSGLLVGHCSGALDHSLLQHERSFSLHPLMTLNGDPESLNRAWATVTASDLESENCAEGLAEALGMRTIQLDDADRALYHAAASVASNFLITVEAIAERLATEAGLPREALVPLVEASVANWASHGARAALTGPIVRGDSATVSQQRAAIETAAPDLLKIFDALCDATADLASGSTQEVGVT